jgi:hypothetical protein
VVWKCIHWRNMLWYVCKLRCSLFPVQRRVPNPDFWVFCNTKSTESLPSCFWEGSLCKIACPNSKENTLCRV